MREWGLGRGGGRIDGCLEHLQYQSQVQTPAEDKPQFSKVIWQNLCSLISLLMFLYAVHFHSALLYISTTITWLGNCLVEPWPSVSCCPYWKPEPFRWQAHRIRSWPQPHEVKRRYGRRRGVGWRNPQKEKLEKSGKQAHKLDRWNPDHIWEKKEKERRWYTRYLKKEWTITMRTKDRNNENSLISHKHNMYDLINFKRVFGAVRHYVDEQASSGFIWFNKSGSLLAACAGTMSSSRAKTKASWTEIHWRETN